MKWSPSQYSKFENERNRPVHDLLAQIPGKSVQSAADIGCGPGNSTQLLKERFPEADVVGVDNSLEMTEAARTRLPNVQFDLADISTWNHPGPFDIILANAVLQWLPDHATLLLFLLSKLSPSGNLAVQIPDNFDEPSHQLLRQIAAKGPWAAKLANKGHAREARHDANWYYRLFRQHNLRVNLWRTTYYHPLAGGPAAIVEWVKGTGLRPFLQQLDPQDQPAFLAEYQTLLADAYPVFPDGRVLFPFPRLFFIASR
ncbi:MAG TPA: trans-aconitate 2-methyltransferase [Tepidisphaeraceae bacterium]|jgi:trans-aconitate 2-methyltransferase